MNTLYTPGTIRRATRAARAAVIQQREAAAHSRSQGGRLHLPPNMGQPFAVGGCSKSCGTQPAQAYVDNRGINDCYHEYAKLNNCAMTAVGGGIREHAGGSRFSFPVEPTQSNYFFPVAMSLEALDSADRTLDVAALLTAVTVKNIPQETYHDPNPTAASVDGVSFASYSGKTGAGSKPGIPGWEIAWGPFSRRSFAEFLELTGWDYGASLSDLRVQIYGYASDTLPDSWKCGQHPGMPDKSNDHNGGRGNSASIG